MVAQVLLLPAVPGWAIDQMWAADQAESAQETREHERIYGSQLMTDRERTEYRAKMRAAASEEEREQIRREHHELMEQRARERGLSLPDEPPAARGGAGQGAGSGNSRRGR